jgi:hypothetical protein
VLFGKAQPVIESPGTSPLFVKSTSNEDPKKTTNEEKKA